MTYDELVERQAEIKDRMQGIDSEFRGQALPDDIKDEFNKLREEHLDNEVLMAELKLRTEQLEELIGDDPESQIQGRREEPTASLHTRRPAASARAEDIWDLSTVRASVNGPHEARAELHDRAKRAIERSQFPHERANQEDIQGHIARLLDRDDEYGSIARRLIETGSPRYQRAFTKTIIGANLTPEESRALSLTGEFGGYAVPFVLDPTIVPTSNGVVNPLRDISRVETITNANEWKGVTSAGTKAAYSAEAAETEEEEFKFVQPAIVAHRASTLLLASFEITQDWGSIQSEIAAAIQDAKDALEAEKFLTGTGENEPYGLLVGATETVDTAEKEKFGIGDVYNLIGALPPRYQPNAKWVAALAIFNRVRQFDTAGGAGLWAQLKEGRPQVLLGKPAYELSTMNTEIKEAKLNMAVGDFSRYVIVDRIGMSIEVIPHVMVGKKATGQRGFYAFWRNGAKVTDKNGFRVLKGKA